MNKTILLKSETATQALAKALAEMNLTGSVWLSGDLGAGKTTLTRYWLQAMGHTGAV
ncbi:tRNA (adenosine(37)-N6)-threonylcarbamoyltransferase complex ATPase subunit type 1 TsaE, partial [Haemophilus influenzae]|nr:tRNA (adenosine(37)-N6)-threonylcarbamoyltransferase complex ATPase subunit type 1 TsaE [Haemophilus influenzae]